MNEEKRICPLLSADFESGYMNCRLDKCAWYYHDRAMCALEAGKYFVGTYLAATSRDLSSKVKALEKPLFNYDGIVHERKKNGKSGGSKHCFYFRTGDGKSTTGGEKTQKDDIIPLFP